MATATSGKFLSGVGTILRICASLAAILTLTVNLAQAVDIPMVPVGNPGNLADPQVMSNDGTTGYGDVAYIYNIGKYEVTNAQYVEFLNAKLPSISDAETGTVLPSDTYGLYNRTMEVNARGGINYDPAGAVGAKFSVKPGYARMPVIEVSWYDAVRFANWLTNGQGNADTENGTYAITGGGQNSGTVSVPDHGSLPAGMWFLPTEDEWYKAAYHKKDGVTANYWDYPTQSDTKPRSLPPPGSTGSANYYNNDSNFTNGYNDGYAVTGSASYGWDVNYLTNVGDYSPWPSAYGTFDQAGNVREWTETVKDGTIGILRGGGWDSYATYIAAFQRDASYAMTLEDFHSGFRIASSSAFAGVPEPSTVVTLLLGVVGVFAWKRRKATA